MIRRYKLAQALLTVAALTVALAAAACDSRAPAGRDDGSIPTDAVVIATSGPDTSELQGESDGRGGGILLIDVNDCGVPDPAVDFGRVQNASGMSIVSEIHAGLTRLVDLGNGVPTAGPELAESFTMHDNATRFEFTLRPELKFSNGQPLLASHVKWSWERALQKSTPPSRARVVLGGIVGTDSIINETSTDLTGVEVIDERKLIVNLTEPLPNFPAVIADPSAFVLQPDNTESWGDIWKNDLTHPANAITVTEYTLDELPVGAGPFKLTQYEDFARVLPSAAMLPQCVLERNQHYWQTDKPVLDGIIATVHENMWADPEANALRQELALADATLDIAQANLAEPTADSPIDDSLFTLASGSGSASVRLLVLNPNVAPFDDPRIRRDFVKAVPEFVFQDRPETTRIIPSTSFGADPDVIGQADGNDTIPDDASLYHDINLYFLSDIFVDDVVELITSAWEETLHATVNHIFVDFTEDEPSPPFIERQVRAVSLSGDVTPFAYDILRTVLEAFGADTMPSEFSDLTTQLTNARHNLDAAERRAQYLDIETTLLDDAYVIPIHAEYWQFELWLQPWVRGLTYPLPGGSYFRDVWFDESAPERTLPTP